MGGSLGGEEVEGVRGGGVGGRSFGREVEWGVLGEEFGGEVEGGDQPCYCLHFTRSCWTHR